jgi:hypothetical protein
MADASSSTDLRRRKQSLGNDSPPRGDPLMAVTQHVVQVVGGSVRKDLWCDECSSSGRFEVDMYAMSTRGMQPIGTVRQCVRCDYEEAEYQEPEAAAG